MTAGLTGTKLGRYEIERELGQGGMSVVYRATDTQLRRPVAIKVMHRFLAEQPEARERFHREAVAVARLHHPHIIEIFDYSGEDADQSYIVTELVEGEALSAMLRRQPIVPPEASLLLARAIAAALSHAHSQGIIHRDLKPENILVGRDGSLKLTDFGIARMLDTNTLTITGTLLGSPAYMAPEYIDGAATDARADIFSFGTMFYQLASGKLPFEGPTPHALLKRIAACEYQPPEYVNPNIHAGLARIIRKCLARLPEERYATVEALIKELDAQLARLELDAAKGLTALLTDPTAFGLELATRLPQLYLKLGKANLKAKQNGRAVEDFDRVLSLDPHNTEVRSLLKKLARRRRRRRVAVVASSSLIGTIVVTLVGSYVTEAWLWSQAQRQAAAQAQAEAAGDQNAPGSARKRGVAFRIKGTGDLYVNDHLEKRRVSLVETTELPPGKHHVRLVGSKRTMTQTFTVPEDGAVPIVELDVSVTEVKPVVPPPPVVTLKSRTVEFKPAGMWVTAYLDDNPEPVVKNAMKTFPLTLAYGKHRLRFVNDRAQLNEMNVIVSDTEPPGGVVPVRMVPQPAKLYIKGAPDGAVIDVAGRRVPVDQWTRDEPIIVRMDISPTDYDVTVAVPGRVDYKRRLQFTAGESQTLTLEP